jgi:hypothetical protein
MSLTTLSQASRSLDVSFPTIRRRMASLGIQPAAVLANGTILLDDDALTRLRASIAPMQQPAGLTIPAVMIHREPAAFC